MQYSSDELSVRENTLAIRSLQRYKSSLDASLLQSITQLALGNDGEAMNDIKPEIDRVNTLIERIKSIRNKQLREDEHLYSIVCQRIGEGQDYGVIMLYIAEKTYMDDADCKEYLERCNNRRNEELIYEFNRDVTEWCREHGTYEVEDFNGTGRTLIIENHSYIDEDTGLQVIEWESWFDDDHSITSVGKTPYEVYCD